jgi:hypothetical protein
MLVVLVAVVVHSRPAGGCRMLQVMGILVVTSWRFIFQPSPSDPAVQKHG